jgi:hypothetical protein
MSTIEEEESRVSEGMEEESGEDEGGEEVCVQLV